MMTASDDAVPGRRELQGPTVLVLEEEAGVRELIVEILELHEFRGAPPARSGECARPDRGVGAGRGYWLSRRRRKPSSPCGRKITISVKMRPTGIR